MPKDTPKKTAKKPAVKKAVSTEVQKPVLKKVEAKTAPKTDAARKGTYFYAAGKRKTSIASVRLYTNGKGNITVNNRTFEQYFPVFTDQDKILAPLRITDTQKLFDIIAKVKGGGVHSQAEAMRHGVSKALLEYNSSLRTMLKTPGYLTRDSRIKERKKYGLHRARRAPQWQKR